MCHPLYMHSGFSTWTGPFARSGGSGGGRHIPKQVISESILSRGLPLSAAGQSWGLFVPRTSLWRGSTRAVSFCPLGNNTVPLGLGIFHGPTDRCVCSKIQENRKLKPLNFKLNVYSIMLTSLFLNLIFLKLDCDQNHLGLLKQIAFYTSISDLVGLCWVLEFAFLTSSRLC